MSAALALVAPAEFIAAFTCPACDGQGERATRYCGYTNSYDTVTCTRCGGTGEVENLDPRDQDVPDEEAA